MQTHPDKTGRRWVSPYYLAGKVAGSKMSNELKKGIEKNKIDTRVWDKIRDKVWAETEKKTGYGDTNYDHQAFDKEKKHWAHTKKLGLKNMLICVIK